MTLSSDDLIVEAVWSRLAADSMLASLMGGRARQYHEWAEPDAPFPYLVHRFRSAPAPTPGMRLGTYVIDIWDHAPTAARLAAIQRRLTELLDLAYLELPELGIVRFWNERWEPVPQDEKNIWRRTSEWGVRYASKRELTAIVTRGG
jgi:hypothetical protein|uniref:DUF3168 domain-containing protein n=2 Tax=Thermorudis TaxID=1649508 RepID=A0A7C2WDZ7_9BACT